MGIDHLNVLLGSVFLKFFNPLSCFLDSNAWSVAGTAMSSRVLEPAGWLVLSMAALVD